MPQYPGGPVGSTPLPGEPRAPKPSAPQVSALTPQPAYVKPATTQQRAAATSTYRQAFGTPSGGYKGAVVHVFKAQPKPVQAQILKSALSSARQSAEAKALLSYLKMGSSVRPVLASLKSLEGASPTDQLSALGSLADHTGYSDFALRLQKTYPTLKTLGTGSGYDLALRLMQADAKPQDAAVIGKALGGEKPLTPMLAGKAQPGAGVSALTKQPAFVAPASVAQRGKAAETFNQVRTAAQGGSVATPRTKADINRLLNQPGSMQGGGLAAIAGDVGLPPATVLSSLGQAGHIAGVTGKFLTQPAVNAAKDLAELPAEAYTSIALPVGDVIHGRFAKAASDIVTPFEQAFSHPLQTLSQHPLDTYLMLSGIAHGASRAIAAPLRAAAPADSALGRALATKRESVALTGNLTHERPAASRSPTIKAGQAALSKARYERAPSGELVPRSPAARDTLISRGVNSLVSARERVRRYNREQVRQTRESAVRPSLPARALHATRTALSYDPKAPVIPGANVLSRIADLTVRRPNTIIEDLQKHLEQVSANRPNLLDSPKLLKEHDQYVKQIRAAIADKNFVRSPDRAFAAAEKYRQDYAPTEAAARQLGHFGDMSAEAMQRRTLMHYAVAHMGAKFDAAQGLVDHAGRPLATQAIIDHLNGPEGTAGRMPAYTPDRPSSNSAFYVSSDRRPLPARERNTLWAYTHGLTDPGHEALTEQHILTQGVVDAHRSQNEFLNTLMMKRQDGGFWPTYRAAAGDAPHGYRPVNVAHVFHPTESLQKALEGTHPATMEEEAARRSLDLSERLRPESPGNRWALIEQHSLTALERNRNLISPNPTLRMIRGLNTQFRQVALGTSAKHVPGVTAENLIRDVAAGVGFRSWITGRRMLAKARELDPVKGAELRPRLTGGQVAGATDFAKTHSTAEFYRGTSMYPVLKGFERSVKAPGARQIRTAWKAWSRVVIQGTKHVLEEQHQIAGLGKAALREHGYSEAAHQGFFSATERLLGLHGQMLEDAAKGLFDPAKARQVRGEINRMYGNWTDLSPAAKWGLMVSPFGLWWVNSVRFLARMPIDQPVKTAALAATTVGTEKQRQQLGLTMFGPGRLPAYMQGGIPAGGKVIAENYYSPFGVANDPLETGASLIQPWLLPTLQGSGGVDYLWRPLSSPQQPRGAKNASFGQRAQYILDSGLASFVPLYTKAEQLINGGSSTYDVGGSNPFMPPTKTPGKGVGAGAEKAFLPWRQYKKPGASASSSKWWGAGSGGGSAKWWGAGGSSGGGGAKWWK